MWFTERTKEREREREEERKKGKKGAKGRRRDIWVQFNREYVRRALLFWWFLVDCPVLYIHAYLPLTPFHPLPTCSPRNFKGFLSPPAPEITLFHSLGTSSHLCAAPSAAPLIDPCYTIPLETDG